MKYSLIWRYAHNLVLIFASVECLANTASQTCIQVALIGEFQRPTSKTSQPFGLEIERGAKIAMSELQGDSAVLCPRLILLDIKNSISNIPDLMRKAVLEEKVRVFLGLGISDQAIVASRAILGLDAIMITPTSSSERLNRENSQTIMLYPTNVQIAKKLAAAVLNRKIKSVATIYSENSEYSRDLTRAFSEAYTKGGGHVVTEVGIRLGQIQKERLQKLLKLKVDRIFLPLYELDTAKVISFFYMGGGITPKYVGSDSWGTYSEVLKKYTGDLRIDAIYPSIYSYNINNSINNRFVRSYRRQFLKNPTDLAAFSYDGLKLANKMFSVCSTARIVYKTSDCLRAALPFNTTSGTLKRVDKASVVRPVSVQSF